MEEVQRLQSPFVVICLILCISETLIYVAGNANLACHIGWSVCCGIMGYDNPVGSPAHHQLVRIFECRQTKFASLVLYLHEHDSPASLFQPYRA